MKNRDWQFHWLFQYRQRNHLVNALIFFIMYSSFFPLMLPYNLLLTKPITLGIFWMGFFITLLLSLQNLWYKDKQSGLFRHYFLANKSLKTYVWQRFCVLWVQLFILITLFIPLFGLLYQLSYLTMTMLCLSVWLVLPLTVMLLFLIFTILIGTQEKSVLGALLYLPLGLPIFVFSSELSLTTFDSPVFKFYILILLGFNCMFIPLMPFLISYMIRIGIDE
jgi:heme exporter protein B